MPRRLDSKSPLKSAPLRNPGQSVDAQIDDLRLDMFGPIMMATVFVVLAALEWFRWYRHDPPHPLLYALFAVGFIAYAIFRTRRSLKRLKSLKLGRDGERAVGQYLEQVRDSGARVLHDIVSKDFNVDHVVLSQQGIFVVETKTWSKPAQGEANIDFDGTAIVANGYKPDRDPMQQVIAQARWLRELLRESTGRTFAIKPVVVFPGWYVNGAATAAAKAQGVWLLNPKQLPSFIAAESNSIAAEDVKLAAYHLSGYIRAS